MTGNTNVKKKDERELDKTETQQRGRCLNTEYSFSCFRIQRREVAV